MQQPAALMTGAPPSFRRGDIVRLRGERWRVVHHLSYGAAAVIETAGCGTDNRAVRARFLLPCEPIERLPSSPAPRLVTPARWRHVARRALGEACPSWASLRAAARASLDVFPFQLEPALALARGAGCRFLIADAVGLGKTIQAGLMIAETLSRRPDARALVISPAGLRDQWCDELRRRFALNVATLDAAGIARLATQLPADVNPWAVQQVAVTSIDFVKRPETMRALEALVWDVMVFDEAHNVAGRSDRAAAAALLADRARALVLLTATPHSGDEAAFARLCGLGNPGGREPLVVFRRTRADAAIAGSRRAPLVRVRPTPAEAAMHQAVIAYARLVWVEAAGGARLVASVLARRACSSPASLARSVERRLALLTERMPSPAQPALPYADADDAEPDAVLGLRGLRDPDDERRRLEEVLRLARAAAAAESKLAALRRLISRIDEPAIVFTEYRDTLERLAAVLGREPFAKLHGGLTARERADALRRFTSGGVRLLLATDAGSEGLNLHHRCRLVINLELPWTPLRLEQRAGRVDRIGQTRRVHVVHLVAAGTCEESTLARLIQRMHRSRGTLSAFETFPDEREVTEAALADRPPAAAARHSASLPSGIVTLDMGDDARREALRIHQARALGAASSGATVTGRAVMARVRGRSRRTAPPCGVWLFQLTFVDATGHLVWESPVAFRAGVTGVRGGSDSCWRMALSARHPALQRLLRDTQVTQLHSLKDGLHEALQRWSARERALIEALRARHARLSAALVQRGLFDRRNERLADAQAALLDRALDQSHARLADLAACGQLRLDDCDLVFAVLLE